MSEWQMTWEGFDPADEGRREALTTLGNGYVATRGAAPESRADGVHYPGTYVAGLYDRCTDQVDGRTIVNESVVNVPNWLPLAVRGPDGWFDDHDATVVEHHVELDLRRGLLLRRTTFEDRAGRRLTVAQRRLVSQRDPHLAALETTLVAEGWDGPVVVRSAIDGDVRNSGVRRYAGLEDRHLDVVEARSDSAEVMSLVAETRQSRIRIAVAVRTRFVADGEQLAVEPVIEVAERSVAHDHHVSLRDGEPVTVEKVAALYTSRDVATSEPAEQARDMAGEVAGSFDELCQRHQVTWRQTWRLTDIELGVDHDIARSVRLNLFHLLQTLSNNTVHLDVGVPARGLHGEAYRGHVFWDELFVFPFLSTRFPQLTRSLLLYRWRRLDAARRAASAAGLAGAMYPWQSASSGHEESQQLHLNPVSGRWVPDATHLQRHVDAAVALNVWQYVQATGDLDFLRFHGAEMMLEIARFWASAATYNRALDRYEIKGVVGPDEYHDGYPDSTAPGLDNNAYTNVMAAWCLCRALDALVVLPPSAAADLRERLDLTETETDRWDEISRKLRVCFHDGVISQFEGYAELEELDWERYRQHYGDIRRLDRILEAEHDTANRYKVSKQADVTMLFFVLSADELAAILTRLGYDYDDQLIPRTIAYYAERDVHGSSLSRLVDAWVRARLDREESWKVFTAALEVDALDSHDGTTQEGIHLGVMAGALDLLQRVYAGLETRDDVLRLHPAIPTELGSLSFRVRYRQHVVDIGITARTATVRVEEANLPPLEVEIEGLLQLVEPGRSIEVTLA
jgi:trehalose/maltose hydrolase-like predicted phosphorylase